MFTELISYLLDIFGIIPYFIQYLIIPFILILWILISKNKCKLDWFIKVSVTGSYVLVLHYAAASDISVGYYTNYFLIILFLISMIISLIKTKELTFFNQKKLIGWIGYFLGTVSILVCLYLNINAYRACFYQGEAIKLVFPFKNGIYLINQGGDGEKSSIMNYHYLDAANIFWRYNGSMRYANDIVKLNKFGFSINSLRLKNKHFIPENLDEYSIFGEKVYSPCSGEVYHVDDGYKDMPASTKKHYSDTGNGIVIKHNNIYVMMWHLKQNSITVKVGEQVKEGQLIGQVGNSGHSSTPHLHIQASKEDWLHGTSVPILFDRKFPVRHSIYIR